MFRLSELSVALVIPLIAGLSTLVVSLCLLWLAATSSDFMAQQREQAYGETLATQIAEVISTPLERGDLLSARASLQRFIDNNLIAGIEIRDVEGLAMGAAGDVEIGSAAVYRATIQVAGDTLGEIAVALNQEQSRESRFRFVFSLLALSAALSLLAYLLSRIFALRLSNNLSDLSKTLALPDAPISSPSNNELEELRRSIEQLPLDMLRGHADVPRAAHEFEQGNVVFVHLASLVRYVDTLSENNLHRYTRRLQQIIQAAAHCYRGDVSVSRPFGLTIRFSPQSNAGSEALRAASCARLICAIVDGLSRRTNLSLDLAMAMGNCEQVSDDVEDIYPSLYLEGAIDELRDVCLNCGDYPIVMIAEDSLGDEQLSNCAQLADTGRTGFRALRALEDKQETLIAHQAQLIIERIKPQSAASP